MFYKLFCLFFLDLNCILEFNFSNAQTCRKIYLPFPSHTPVLLLCSGLHYLPSKSAAQLTSWVLFHLGFLCSGCHVFQFFSLSPLFVGAHALISLLKNDSWKAHTASLLSENAFLYLDKTLHIEF